MYTGVDAAEKAHQAPEPVGLWYRCETAACSFTETALNSFQGSNDVVNFSISCRGTIC